MIRNLCIVAAILGLTLLGAHWLLAGSNLITYAERSPWPEYAPMLDYYAGQAHYTAQNYDEAIPYFKYVFNRFPLSPYAERAHAYWLECLSRQLYRAPAQAVAECKTFLKQYPDSEYAPRVRKLLEICESATLH